jgi:hypothetical protein
MPVLKKTQDELCEQRSRIAALRDNVDAPSLAVHKDASDLYTGAWSKENLIFEVGDDLVSDREAVSLINELRSGSGSKGLSPKQVWIHWLEAANTNFIGDRFMFLDASTLKNVAARGSDGFAFMNSHRTGGLSSPAEMPYGYTFAGRYEEAEDGSTIHRRALVGVYMLRNAFPNGTGLPGTDDLHKAIKGGTLRDVSMGLVGGSQLCDVCVRELGSEDCPHIPGTHKELSPEQIESQTKRGATKGVASFSLVDAMPQEVSAVFKGAVPGAGFRKAMKFVSSGESSLASQYRNELLSAYGGLLDQKSKTLLGSKDKKMPGILDALKFWKAAGEPDLSPDELTALITGDVGTAVPKETGSKVGSTVSSVAPSEVETRLAQAAETERKAHLTIGDYEGKTKLSPFKATGKLSPKAFDSASSLYKFAYLDDIASPLSVDGKTVKRTDLLMQSLSEPSAEGLMSEEIGDTPTLPAGQTALSNDPNLSEDAKESARLAELMGHTPLGQSVANKS